MAFSLVNHTYWSVMVLSLEGELWLRISVSLTKISPQLISIHHCVWEGHPYKGFISSGFTDWGAPCLDTNFLSDTCCGDVRLIYMSAVGESYHPPSIQKLERFRVGRRRFYWRDRMSGNTGSFISPPGQVESRIAPSLGCV